LQLRIVTVATKELVNTTAYKYLKDSLDKSDHEFITLGANDYWNGGDLTRFPGGGKKVIYLKEYLNSTKFDYDDYLLFCDGGDTFCNAEISISDVNSILPNELVFATETSYWPNWDLKEEFESLSTSFAYHNKYLNSGLFIGRTNYIKSLLNEYDLIKYDYQETGAPETVDDQYYYQKIFLDNKNKITLDYTQKWFQCLGPISDNTKIGNSKFVHANGNAKEWYDTNILPVEIEPSIDDLPSITPRGLDTKVDLQKTSTGVRGPRLENSDSDLKPLWEESFTKHPLGKIGCYVITIHPEETEKRIKELKKYVPILKDINVIIVNGIRGEKVSTEVLNKKGWRLHPWKLNFHHLDWYHRDINDMEVGCALSHAGVWDSAVENDFDFTFVFEEDFDTSEIFDLDLYKFPDEVDLIYINRIKNEPNALELPYKKIEDVEWSYPSKSYNTSSYILSRKGAKSLQDQNLYDKIMPVDEFLCACYGKADRHDLQRIIFPDLVAIATQDHSDWFKQKDDIGVDGGIHKRPNFPASVSPPLRNKNWNLLINPVDNYLYEIPFISKEWCSWLIQEAENLNQWTEGRHDFYATYDILLEKLNPQINEYYSNALQEYMIGSAKHFYQLEGDNWNKMKFENFVVKYSAETQPALGVHHDSSLISTVLTLNDKSEFEGGGTWFPRQELLHFGNVGHLSVHPGNITHKHGAKPVTSGNRYVLITFSNYEN